MRWRFVFVLLECVLALGWMNQAFALKARIEVNEEPWYTSRKGSVYQGTSLTKYYAPLPVFFEGWKSSPREDIVDYLWDFGDGSPFYHGFNAAHVYEKAGNYKATLLVIDKRGKRDVASQTITVIYPNGKTYYVDAVAGDDANAGTSTNAPWRTATHAFRGMLHNRYQPGDRILFKRGQTFPMLAGLIRPGHYRAGYGYTFGAYGSGPKPIIQKIGNSTAPLILVRGVGLAHFCISNIEFRMTSPEGIKAAEVFFDSVPAFNLLLLRVDIKGFSRGLSFNGNPTDRRIGGVFIVDCTMFDSSYIDLYTLASKVGLLDNQFDLAGNHIAYLPYLDKAVIAGNTLTRPAFGRTALRVAGPDDFGHPSNNVQISDNFIEGWIDPVSDSGAHNGGGRRYNYLLVDLGPNEPGDKALDYVTFERNTVVDGETLLSAGAAHNLVIRDNEFYTDDTCTGSYRIQLGHTFERRPLKDVLITNNNIVSNENRTYQAGVIGIRNYRGPAFEGQAQHESIAIIGNTIVLKASDGTAPVVYVEHRNVARAREVVSDYNTFYAPSPSNLFQIGGTWLDGDMLNLSRWRGFTGNDYHSTVQSGSKRLVPRLF